MQVPRAVYWKIPFLPPVASQPAIDPSPAPMSLCDDRDAQVGEPGRIHQPLHEGREVSRSGSSCSRRTEPSRRSRTACRPSASARTSRPCRVRPPPPPAPPAPALASAWQRPPTAAGSHGDGHDEDERGRTHAGPRDHRRYLVQHHRGPVERRSPVVRAGRQHEPVVAEAVDEVRDPDRRIGDVAVGRRRTSARCTGHGPVSIDNGFLHVTVYGRRRAGDRGDDDLLIRERLQRAKLRRRSSRRASACRRPRPRRIRPGSPSRSRLRSAPGAAAWRHCRGGRTRCSGSSTAARGRREGLRSSIVS